MQTNYGFGKPVSLGFDAALGKVTQALATEGFGVLTDIDVAATLKKELGKDMPAYRILGACHPGSASQAIDAEPSIGLLLPCNVVVRQDEAGIVHVEFMDPQPMFALIGKREVGPLAAEVRARLVRVMNAI